MDAGKLNYRVAFDAPIDSPNGQGGTVRGFEEQHQCNAAFLFLRGGETAIASRLAGKQPAVVTIGNCAAAREIGTDWRMRDVRTGVTYNIRAIIPSDDRAWLELTVESGVAA